MTKSTIYMIEALKVQINFMLIRFSAKQYNAKIRNKKAPKLGI